MKIAVVAAVYNEEKNLPQLLKSLLSQNRILDEIVIVDDGSTDQTPSLIESYQKNHPAIRSFHSQNCGPATARNLGWRNTSSDIVVFTDGDCVPESCWIEKLIHHFDSEAVAAVGGTYRTLNPQKILARFIGYEIAWRYRNVGDKIDAHGAYNLAVRKKILEETGGFNEDYKKPSGEDWDLTYRISRLHLIRFAPDAIVAHAHPEQLFPYLGNQMRRGFDRIKLYNDHPEKRNSDVYTDSVVKYQVLAAGLLFLTVPLSFLPVFYWISLGLSFFLLGTCFRCFPYIAKYDPKAAWYGIWVQWLRCFAWLVGAVCGVLKFGLKAHK